MGLDAHMYRYKGNNRKKVDFKHNETVDEEIAYWRKNPNLEEYMAALYFHKGGKGIDSFGSTMSFNCCKLQLEDKDLKDLEALVRGDNLPPGGGFFHGGNADAHYKQDTLEAIKEARGSIEDGYKIYYTSWW